MLSVFSEQCEREVVSPFSNYPLIIQDLTANEVNIPVPLQMGAKKNVLSWQVSTYMFVF